MSRTATTLSTVRLWETKWPAMAALGQVNTLPADAAGNTVSYVIHRLCMEPGTPPWRAARCRLCKRQGHACRWRQQGAPMPTGMIQPPDAVFYRVTVRVAGPANTSGLVQAIVSF